MFKSKNKSDPGILAFDSYQRAPVRDTCTLKNYIGLNSHVCIHSKKLELSIPPEKVWHLFGMPFPLCNRPMFLLLCLYLEKTQCQVTLPASCFPLALPRRRCLKAVLSAGNLNCQIIPYYVTRKIHKPLARAGFLYSCKFPAKLIRICSDNPRELEPPHFEIGESW